MWAYNIPHPTKLQLVAPQLCCGKSYITCLRPCLKQDYGHMHNTQQLHQLATDQSAGQWLKTAMQTHRRRSAPFHFPQYSPHSFNKPIYMYLYIQTFIFSIVTWRWQLICFPIEKMLEKVHGIRYFVRGLHMEISLFSISRDIIRCIELYSLGISHHHHSNHLLLVMNKCIFSMYYFHELPPPSLGVHLQPKRARTHAHTHTHTHTLLSSTLHFVHVIVAMAHTLQGLQIT